MAENLNKIWASGQNLCDYFGQLEAIAAAENELQLPTALNSDDPISLALNSVAKTVTITSREKAIYKVAREILKNRLVGGEITLLGRFRDDAGTRYVRIAPGYWIDAAISPEANSAVSAGYEIDELRIDLSVITQPTGHVTTSPGDGTVETAPAIEMGIPTAQTPPSQRGRPSKRANILDAIAHYSSADPDWWSRKVTVRRQAYYDHLKKHHGLSPSSDDGIEPKTIQKYETEFRKINNKQRLQNL